MNARPALPFTKGHGTENDFVVVPDPTGELDLDAELVRRLSDRRAGIGADGVIRVVRTEHAGEASVRAQSREAEWFMDYRNADGSIAEMCGNGTRVFAAYLVREGWEQGPEFGIATRAGVKYVRVEDERIAVNLGRWRVADPERFATDGHDAVVALHQSGPWPGLSMDLGNPHTVVALPEEVDLGALDLSVMPSVIPMPAQGTNVELARVTGPGRLQMRVFERGVGETRSCGTGACATALAFMLWSGEPSAHEQWQVDLPGGSVQVTALPSGEVELAGPAELVADGLFVLG
ncbi:diaminopimelate epimerase [Austwickia chelonae]|nr:diaminopimelate epimerase [Austwickia chelonae]SEW08107.1 diaminopimelate epimerase [Austwickia chelonae]